ncbi:MAG: hypothetical protein HKN82_03595 [Akkermansiaceae bacterium]|nr:hypothetical protein [Akkermansiaceae bacterium]NNM30261.1 hypothetical protein [Akkermansiaceae bacterium]
MRLLLVLAVLPALLCTSCIEGEESVWLKRNGSGRIEASYHLPEIVVQQFGGGQKFVDKLRSAIDADPEIHLEDIGHERADDGRVHFHFAARFDDLQALVAFPQKRLRDPAAPDVPVREEALFGVMDLEINDLKLSLHREIDLAPILPAAVKGTPALLGDSKLVFRVHLPVPAAHTNAATVSPDGKLLEWSFLLRDHTAKPMILNAGAPLPLPWWIWFTLVLIIIVFLALLFLAARRMILMRR